MTWGHVGGTGTWGDGWGTDSSPTSAEDIYAVTVDPDSFVPGNYSLTIHAIDEAGNEQVSEQLTFSVEDTNPRPAQIAALPLQSVWEVFVRDDNYEIVGVLDSWKEASGVERAWTVGNWTCSIDLTNKWAGYAQDVLARRRYGIVITCDGTPVLSGPVTERAKSLTADGARSVTFSGPDDMVHLAGRRTKPEPATPAPPYSTDAYDTRTGIATTVILGFVEANLGASANDRRKIPLVLDADPTLGSNVTWPARYEQLLAIIARLARSSDPQIMFSLRQDLATSGLRFSTSVVTDRSSSIVFSEEAGTLRAYEYAEAFGFGNYIYELGAGSGTSRTVFERENTPSIIDYLLYELVGDQRSTSDPAALLTAARADLTNTLDTRTIKIDLEPHHGNRWPLDYRAGDLVAVEIDGVVLVETLAELAFDITKKGETLTPTVSNRIGPSLFQPVQLALLDRRLAQLEAD